MQGKMKSRRDKSKKQSKQGEGNEAYTVKFTPPDAEKVKKILDILWQTHPDARVALRYENALELLVATILSAQCTDERVNAVTPILFNKYKTAQDFANCDINELKEIIRSTGFFNQKARFIKEMAIALVEKFDGKVPDNMADLITLPGVARKTANVVLGAAFGRSEGIVVDTHVKRVAYRIGLTKEQDPEKIERDLMKLIPHDKWDFIGNALIFHGRRICKARKPECHRCPLNELCASAFTF